MSMLSTLLSQGESSRLYKALIDEQQKAVHVDNIPLALEAHHEALKIREELGDKMGVAGSLNNIGFIYAEQKDLPLAITYYNKALAIREEIGDQKGIALSYNNLGVAYRDQGDQGKALEYFQKALKLNTEIENKSNLIAALNNIGFIHKEQGNIPMDKSVQVL